MSVEFLVLNVRGLCHAPAGELMGSTEALVKLEPEASRMVGLGVLGGQRVDKGPQKTSLVQSSLMIVPLNLSSPLIPALIL